MRASEESAATNRPPTSWLSSKLVRASEAVAPSRSPGFTSKPAETAGQKLEKETSVKYEKRSSPPPPGFSNSLSIVPGCQYSGVVPENPKRQRSEEMIGAPNTPATKVETLLKRDRVVFSPNPSMLSVVHS